MKEVEIVEDVIMPQFIDEDGSPVVLSKGVYPLVNNEMFYNPSQNKLTIKKACIEHHAVGHVFGHEVEYTITSCVYYISWRNKATNKNSSIVVTPKLSMEQLKELSKNNNEITFSKDVTIEIEDFSYTLKAGNYNVSEDGNIYIINAKPN